MYSYKDMYTNAHSILICNSQRLEIAQIAINRCITEYSPTVDSRCSSVAKSGLNLFNPMDCSMPGSSVFRYRPEFAQIHVH